MKDKILKYETCCAETDKIYYSDTETQVRGFRCTNGRNEDPNYYDYKKELGCMAHMF